MSSMAASSYWCYRCSRFVRVSNHDSAVCPDCNSGFVEQIEHPSRLVHVEPPRRRFPAAAVYRIGHRSNSGQNLESEHRRSHRNRGDCSPFNPVIVLRGPSDGTAEGGENRRFEFYYDDGGGSGLRPLPPSMSEFLLGSGFDRLLEQLSQIELNAIGRFENLPASKAAIEAMPTIQICENHLETESHCAVCKEVFKLRNEAMEMPCKHIYHSDCILPWLSIRNSCPVCRHELPSDNQSSSNNEADENGVSVVSNVEENVGLTIWRLPGGGFAVGRFRGGRRGGERELPVVYTEVDGGFNNGGVPRRISWSSIGRGRERERGGFSRIIRSLFSCFVGSTRSMASTSSSTTDPGPSRSRTLSQFDSEPRRRRTWSMEVNGGIVNW